MAASALLQKKLSDPPATPLLRRTILDKMFSIHIYQQEYQENQCSYAAYFSHWYEEHCNDRTGAISMTTHSILLDIVRLVRDGNEDRESIQSKVKATLPTYSEESINVLISLAARLWTMSCIGEIRQCLTLGQTLTWQQNSLSQLLSSRFAPNPASKEDVVLLKSFHALSCEKVAGIKICWTSNILDHLKMTDDDRTVHIFHHTAFLELHKRVSRSVGSCPSSAAFGLRGTSSSDTFPAGFLEETVDTLALLLPRNRRRVKTWYRRKANDLGLDPSAAECRPLGSSARRTTHFPHWGDRISILKQAFDESEPRTLAQWWHDDRKRVQWYTFWVAILALLLTVTLGILQCAASIVQAWASVKALHHVPS